LFKWLKKLLGNKVCVECGSDNAYTETAGVIGHQPGKPSQWVSVTTFCRNCNHIERREEF
jgi:hypothetical protein